jgi:hypothetical protein
MIGEVPGLQGTQRFNTVFTNEPELKPGESNPLFTLYSFKKLKSTAKKQQYSQVSDKLLVVKEVNRSAGE